MRPIVTDVAWSLLWLFVTTMSCAETAKPIKPFGDCPRYRILDGDRDPTGKMGIFFGGGQGISWPIVKCMEYLALATVIQQVAAAMRPFAVSTAATCCEHSYLCQGLEG